MARKSADYTEALSDIDQAMLDSVSDLAEMRRMSSAAFLYVGAMHGVSVVIEPPLAEGGDVPAPVRQGLTLRFLLPKGISREALEMSLAGGPAARLITSILDGHRLRLSAEGGTGSLTRAGERARTRLFEILDRMAPAVPGPSFLRPRRDWLRRQPVHAAAPCQPRAEFSPEFAAFGAD